MASPKKIRKSLRICGHKRTVLEIALSCVEKVGVQLVGDLNGILNEEKRADMQDRVLLHHRVAGELRKQIKSIRSAEQNERHALAQRTGA